MNIIKNIISIICPCLIRNNDKFPEKDVNEYIIEKKNNLECHICLEEFKQGETVSLIKCGHFYHTHCLYSWFLSRKVCPLCDIELIID